MGGKAQFCSDSGFLAILTMPAKETMKIEKHPLASRVSFRHRLQRLPRMTADVP